MKPTLHSSRANTIFTPRVVIASVQLFRPLEPELPGGSGAQRACEMAARLRAFRHLGDQYARVEAPREFWSEFALFAAMIAIVAAQLVVAFRAAMPGW